MRQTIREMAHQLLKQHRITNPPIPVEKIAESQGVKIDYTLLEGDVSGVLYKKKKKVTMGVNITHVPARQRFTIAHELGHLLLHKTSELFVDRKFVYRDANSKTGLHLEEREANAFAAELLMPDYMIEKAMKAMRKNLEDSSVLEELATRFGVSNHALTIRLVNLGHLSPDDMAVD